MAYLFEGDWDLVPELSHDDDGTPPRSGHYLIRADGDALSFRIDWTDGTGKAHSVAFEGKADGKVRPAGPDGMDASFHVVGEAELISRAYQAGQEVSYAHRRASPDGTLLSILQFHNHPDGSRSLRSQVFRRRGAEGRGVVGSVGRT